ncbi:hypothetical protein [Pseudoalteromonas sp. ZZD1]|uniref:hypothetical protein n=1 Tax=Pseudoalteromonas sp. ZZD1 TaxID=3139395 RepID=UPI003BAA70ED
MIKNLAVSILVLLLWGCSEPELKYSSIEQIDQQIKIQNVLLQPNKTPISVSVIKLAQLPFSEQYLEQRHTIYKSLRALTLDENTQQLADYLSISERFPARYFPWPSQVNVVENMLNNNVPQQQISDWIDFTAEQLSLGLQSKLKLNKIELAEFHLRLTELKSRDDLTEGLTKSLNSFNTYLQQYTPRGSVGLHGLPNGSPWYQSKLNYFAGKTDAPLKWLVKIQKQLANIDNIPFTLTLQQEHRQSVLEQWLESKSLDMVSGFDWSQGYYNLPLSASRALQNMSNDEKYFWLAMMETDIGIHYHAWTIQQAKVNLSKRLNLSSETAEYLVNDIVFYPAFSFSFASLLKAD